MAGCKLEFGLRYKGVLTLLDYQALREGKIVCVQALDREVYTRDSFPDPSADGLEKQDPLPSLFIEDTPEVRKKTKRVYITFGRIQRLGPTPACRACLAFTPNHTPECVARHEDAHGHASRAPTPRARGELEELLDEAFPPGLDFHCIS